MREAGVTLVGASICPGGFEMRIGFWWWGWPAQARRSPLARALAQLDLVERMVAADPTLRIVRTREDLEAEYYVEQAMNRAELGLAGGLPSSGLR